MNSSLLFISPSSPFPFTDGKRQRTFALLSAALEFYSIDFLIIGSSKEEVNSFNKENIRPNLNFISLTLASDPKWMKKIGLSYFSNKTNRNTLSKFLKAKSYDKIFCRYVLSARDLPLESDFYLDVDDDYEEVMKTKIYSQSSILKKMRYFQIFVVNIFFYKNILSRAKKIIGVREQKQKGYLLPNLPFQILHSGIHGLFPPQSKNLLFVGKLSYEPNSSGLLWFLDNVWANLKIRLPETKLTVISSVKPNNKLQRKIDNSMDVNLQINVPEVQKFYIDHAMCIVPIFSGGGSNVKLAEALVMGRIIVSSAFGCRGYEKWIYSGQVLIANSPIEWESLIVNELNIPWNGNLWSKVIRHFSLKEWNSSFLKILNEY